MVFYILHHGVHQKNIHVEVNMLKQFINKCEEDFWYYPKWAMCYALWIFTIMSISDTWMVNNL